MKKSSYERLGKNVRVSEAIIEPPRTTTKKIGARRRGATKTTAEAGELREEAAGATVAGACVVGVEHGVGRREKEAGKRAGEWDREIEVG